MLDDSMSYYLVDLIVSSIKSHISKLAIVSMKEAKHLPRPANNIFCALRVLGEAGLPYHSDYLLVLVLCLEEMDQCRHSF